MPNTTTNQILEKALHGNGITPTEANILMNPAHTALEALIKTAHQLTLQNFGNEIGMCAIYPAKVGLCSGDCAFCAQSSHHNCNISPVDTSNLDEDEIVHNAKTLWESGVSRYSLVTSSEVLTDTEFDIICQIFRRLRSETNIGLCASLGSLTYERACQLKRVGVSRYHHNIETCRSYFPHICTTHSYDDKIQTITTARGAGLEICSGGIIALGETAAQRVELAFALKDMDVDCVPINILNPIAGTRLEKQPPLSTNEILRTVSVFRLILPHTVLRFAGGREKALGNEEYTGYTAGINAILAGNYLTTSGKDFAAELYNIRSAGYVVKESY